MMPSDTPTSIDEIICTVRFIALVEYDDVADYTPMIDLLVNGQLELEGLMPWSSNHTFLGKLIDESHAEGVLAIYKPEAGARPLWDFPRRTLHQREFLSYLLSQFLGWPNIPPTAVRSGPHGSGSVQIFVNADYELHYFNLRDEDEFETEFCEMALFDIIANNADRKGGHCLKDEDGQLWAIDHGLTFHEEFKLRTVIHEFCGNPIPTSLMDDLKVLQNHVVETGPFQKIMGQLLSQAEVDAFQTRLDLILDYAHFPRLNPYNVPYPPI